MTLTALGTVDGFAGTFAGLTTGFNNFNSITATAETGDQLTGLNQDAIWDVTGLSYTSGTRTLTFTGFEHWVGGNAADTFRFDDASAFTGIFDGAAGLDVLDYSAASIQVQTVFTALGSVDGFAGTTTGLLGTFDNINSLVGGTHISDTITGANLAATFELDGTDRYFVGLNEIAFTGYEVLVGGSLTDTFIFSGARSYIVDGGAGNDIFRFNNGSSLTGTLNGSTGSDLLDLSGYASSQAVHLVSTSVDGFAGYVTGTVAGGFSNIDRVYGSPTATNDQLYGMDVDAQWDINGASSQYTVGSNTINFLYFDRLEGGQYADTFLLHGAETGLLFGNAGDDIFRMMNGASLNGSVMGGGGVNLLDYSLYTTPVNVNLADGIATNITLVGSIQSVYGGSADDTLIGNNGENTLKGNGGDDYLAGGDGNDVYLFEDVFGQDTLVETTGVDTLDFSAVTSTVLFNLASFNLTNGTNSLTYNGNQIERFIGGTLDDTFFFADGFALPASGRIDGSGGSDWLNYSAYTTSVTVNLTSGAATGVPAGVINIENVIGGSAGDSLTGSASDNILEGRNGNDTLTGLGGNDTLNGGNGNDTYVFSGNVWGTDTLLDSAGTDTVDFLAATGNLLFDIAAGTPSVTDGTNTLTFTSGNVVERLLGGTGDDTFRFENGVGVAGGGAGTFIDGGLGNNTLDYTAYTTDVFVNLTTNTATGVNAGLPGGIDRIQNVLGGTSFNEIWGDEFDNILESGSTNDILHGLAGNDTYVFYDDWGTDYVYDTSGNDTLVFHTSYGVTFTFAAGSATVTDAFGNIVTTDGNVENFTGSEFDDNFIFQAGGSILGTFDGRGGYDTVNLSAVTSAIQVTLTGLGSVDGFNGTIASRGSFANVNQMTASALNGDSLTGRNADAEFILGAADQYVSVNTFDFSNFEILNGGTAADIFRIQTSHTNTLNGGAGDDRFILSAGAVLTGAINGGAGNDAVDFSALAARTVSLTGIGSVDGFNGSDTAITGGFSNINQLEGTVGTDTLVGANLAATFELDGTDRYIVGSNTLSFSSFENLTGGSAVDTFAFNGTYNFTGTLNGAGGTDWLDYTAYGAAVHYNQQTGVITGLTGTFSAIEGLRGSASTSDLITGADTGTTFNMTGAGQGNLNGTFSFTSIENLAGGSGSDTLNYSGYASAVTMNMQTGTITGLLSFTAIELVNGSANSDTIVARDSGSIFVVNAANAVSVDGQNFTSFENLTGAAGNDTFQLTGSGSLSGVVNGNAGTDLLTYNGYGSAVSINLQTMTATGLPAGFVSIETMAGSAYSDTITGPNATSNYQITGTNSGTAAGISFTSIENLTGGSGNDVFAFQTGGTLSGNLNGAAGTDMIDFSTYSVGVTVNLLTGTASTVGGSVSGVENIQGSMFNDTLVGDNNANIINAIGGVDVISGNGGNDRFIFPAGSFFSGVLAGGAGSDQADFSSQVGVISIVLTAIGTLDGFNGTINGVAFSDLENVIASTASGDSLTGMNAAATWDVGSGTYTSTSRVFTYSNVENLIGGNAADTFAFANGVVFNGTIDGGAGNDALNYAAYTTARNLVLVGLGSLDGFSGTEASISGGFTNINSYVGSTSTSDSLTGRDVDTTWAVDGTNLYSNGSNQLSYTAIEILIGGSAADIFNISGNRVFILRGGAGNDVFNFANGAVLTGSIAGGEGNDTLSFAAYTSARNVVLTSAGADGFGGTQAAITAGFGGIDTLIGSSAATDTLTGLNAEAVFNIAASHSYTSGGYTLSFSSYENLVGGSAADTFAFIGTGTLSGTINGSGGTDTIDYSAYSTGATVNLNTGMATALGGGVVGRLSNVENITGSAFNDSLTGDAGANVFRGLNGNDTLTGLGGNDTYIFVDGFGQDTIVEAAAGGSDTLDFSAVTNGLSLNINASSLTGGYGANSITLNGLTAEVLIASLADDIFNFTAGGSFNGSINGFTGIDTFDYHLYTGGVNVNLSTGAATGTLGVSNIENLIGSNYADTLTGDDHDNVITGGAGNDMLTGLGGNDLYLFQDNFGVDSIVEAALGGEDTMDFTAVTQMLTMTVTDTTVHVTYGVNDASHTGIYVEHFLGALGQTTLDLSAYLTGRHVVLTNLGTDHGFMGYVEYTPTPYTFDNIDRIIGTTAADDSLTGMNAIALWTLTEETGGSYVSTNTLTFTGFESLIGGSDADTFRVTEGITYIGAVDGAAGEDTLSYSAYTTDVQVDLTGLGSMDGFNLTAPGIAGGLMNIDRLVGGDGLDTLNALSTAGTFEFGLISRYINSGHDLEFSALEQLNGSDENDSFVFLNSYGFSGSIDGKGGNDTLTYADYSTPVAVTFTGIGATDGFNGIATNLGGIFTNINTVIGGSGSDTLTGINSDSIFRFDTTYTYNSESVSATFLDFDRLVGGNGNDLFQFVGLATYTGDIDGGLGTDLLDYHLYDIAVTVDLGGIHATALFGTFVNLEGMIGSPYNDTLIGRVAGSTFHVTGQDQGDVDDNFTFVSVEHLQGGSGPDVLDYSRFAGPVAFVLTGDNADGFSGTAQYLTVGFSGMNALIGTPSANDSLTGRDGIANWEITSANGGTYDFNARIISYTDIENLLGGALADTFHVHEGVTYQGSLDGRAGVDILTYYDYTSDVNVILTGLGAIDGFDGTAPGMTNGFHNMDRLIGGNGSDSLTGTDLDAVFSISSNDQYQAGGHTFDFERLESLIGGSGRDTFLFANGASFPGTLNGGAGVDTLDYSAYTTSVTVNLMTGTATGTNGVSAIENITGGSANDNLTGDNGDNVITGNAGNDTLTGNGGNDTFIFVNGWGSDTVNGNTGEDTLDFSGVTSAINLTVNLFTRTVTGDAGGAVSFNGIDVIRGGEGNDVFNITGSQDYDLYGNGGNDAFRFFDSGLLIGLIAGGAGHDVLDYQNDAGTLLTSRYFTLTGIGASGFNGTEATISAGFTDIDEIIAGQGADTLEGVNLDGTFHIHTSSVDYDAGGTNLHLSYVENLVGGIGDDTFIFDDGAALPGTNNSIDGKAGFDTLDYSAYTTPVYVNLIGGTATGTTNGVASIERVIGSLVSETEIYGDDNDNTFIITGPGGYRIYGRGGNDTYIFDADNLLDHVYIYEDAAHGGWGVDTIDFSLTTTIGVTVSLNTESDQTINSNLLLTVYGTVENLTGSEMNDHLTGNNGVNIIKGGAGNDTIIGMDGSDRYLFGNGWGVDTVTDSSGYDVFDFSAVTEDLTANLTSTALTIGYGSNLVTSTLSEIENLIGGSGDDLFVFANGVQLSGVLNGGLGDDRIDLSAYTTGRAIVLTGLGSLDGYAGSDSTIPAGFDNIEWITGTTAVDTLTGLSLNSHWTAQTPVYTYTVDGSGRTLTFTSFDTLIGMSANDVFTIMPGTQTINIYAGPGDDTLVMSDGARLTGFFEGQGDYDTIDYHLSSESHNFHLGAVLGTTDGFNVYESCISVAAYNIQQIIGGTVLDSLYGRDVPATWDVVNGVDTYTDTRVLHFDLVEDLYGQSYVDTFHMSGNHIGRMFGQGGDDFFYVSNDAVLFAYAGDTLSSGYMDGGSGYDQLDYTGYGSASAFDLTAIGITDGFNGTVASLYGGFFNFNYILGRIGSGYDSLQGLDTNSVWNLVNTDLKSEYITQSRTLHFSYIDSLIGEGAEDRFVFGNGVTLTGSINGGAGNDTLDYSAYTTARNMVLTERSADGFAGTETSLGIGFSQINAVIGGSALDTLTTLNSDSSFLIDRTNGGTYTNQTNTLEFTSFDNLVGGSAADTFFLSGSGTIANSIHAGDGSDEINYSLYGSAATVDLLIGSASGVNGGVAASIFEIENITGSIYADTLTGDSGANRINGLGGNDLLTGLAGNDIYVFQNGWGTDIVVEQAAGGSDTFDFSAATVNLLFTQNTDLSVSSGSDLVNASANYIENLIGGQGNDTFHITGSSVLNGYIDGQGGSNTLSFSGNSVAQNIILTSAGTLVGFAGTTTSVVGGFDNITDLVGTAQVDDLTGMAGGGTFHVNGANSGSYTSTTSTITFTAVDSLNGSSGYDTLDFSGYTTGRDIGLTGVDVNGFTGTESSLSGFFRGMDRIIGSAAVDSLTGLNQASTYEIDGTERYLTGSYALDLDAIENLNGGTANDLFLISAAHTGRLNGGAGTDTLDYTASLVPVNARLTGLGAVDGFNGTETNLTDGFANMDELIGGMSGDQLTGMDVAYNWNISPSTNQYVYGGHTFSFSHIEVIAGGSANDTFTISGNANYTLLGGDGDDTFTFQNGATLTGILDGQAGNDFVDYHLYTIAVHVNLNDTAVTYNSVVYLPQSAPGINGGMANGITNIESVTGSAADDILIGSSGANTLNGSAGNDVLIGLGGNDTYLFGNGWGNDNIIEEAGGGTDTISFALATTAISFTRGVTGTCTSGTCATDGTNAVNHTGGYIESFTGGSGNDTFTLTNGMSMPGSINGGAGVDVLNLTAFTTALNYTLTGPGSVDGFAGTVSPLSGGFDNINTIQSGSGIDTLTGANADSTFTVASTGIIYQSGSNTLNLTSVENLNGGTENDTFRMMGTAVLAGRINGGNGLDTLDYSGYSTAVSINLTTGTATGVTGGIQSIENVIGSPVRNVITGDNNDNILIGTSGEDEIYGLGGNDTLIGLGGNDLLDGGLGVDTVDYSGNTYAGVNVNLVTNTVTSAETGTDTLVGIENVIGTNFADVITGNNGNNVIDGRGGNDTLAGGGGNDTFVFGSDWGVDTLTDSAGTDTLNFSAVSSDLVVQVNSTGLSVSSGANSLTVSGTVIENIITGTGNDTFSFGSGASLTGTIDGRSGNNTLDLSATAGSTINLTGLGTITGFSGNVAGILNAGFDNITDLIGSTVGTDTLIGMNTTSVWNVNNSGNSYQSGGRTLTFSQVENLTGGSAADTFNFTGSGSISGSIQGGSGTNVLDYSAYTAGGITVSLQAMTATGVGGTFSNIGALTGSGATDTILVPNAVNTITITAANAGTANGTFSFSAVENITGGSMADTFVFADHATMSGTLNGNGGTDTLDYRAYTTNLNINLSTGIAAAGGVSTTVSNIENIVSGQANDVITGDGGDNVLTDVGGTDIFDGGLGNDTYVFLPNWGNGDVVTGAGGIDWMDFSNISDNLVFDLTNTGIAVSYGSNSVTSAGYIVENLVAGSGADQFNITGNAVVNLFGNGGNDSFNFNGSGSLNGNLDGGTGTNTMNYAGYGSPVTYNLQTGAINAFTGSKTNIQAFIGSAFSDTIIGRNSGTAFNVTGSNAGNVDGTLTFSSVENLLGGTGNDTFNLNGTGSLTGIVDGISGYDTLNYSAYTSAVATTLTGADADGFDGNSIGLASFANIDRLVASNQTDSLTGVDNLSIFDIDGTNQYILGGYILDFSGYENLHGGSAADQFIITGNQSNNLYGHGGNDQFIFKNNAILTGSIDGAAGQDILDTSAYTTARTFVLTGLGDVDGFNGTTNVLTGTFANINNIVGSAATGDTFTGLNAAAVFDLAAGTYTGTRTLLFTGIENLNGGNGADQFLINANVTHNLNGGGGNDEFVFSNTNQLTGNIQGGAGTDTLNYYNYTAPVTVNFASGTATAVSGSVTGMENFIGSHTASNTVYGDDNDNILVGGPSDDTLIGGKGNDTYIFTDGWGTDHVVELPNEGNDTLDFSGVTGTGVTVILDGTTLVVTDGTNTVDTGTINNVENVIGTNQADTFQVNGNATIAGKLDGAGGSDVLDYSGYASARNFILTGIGTVDGFKGIEASLPGGFDNMDEIVGTSFTDSLTGMNASATWNLTGTATETYVSSGRTLNFTSLENLVGGTAADAFVFTDGAGHTGNINGGAGIDLLDYNAYTTDITVNLSTGAAQGVTGSVSLVENVTGGAGNDHITGDQYANVLSGNGGNDQIYGLGGADTLIGGAGDDDLYGGDGNDRYVFADGWGADEVFETSGAGSDKLDFGTVTADLLITLVDIDVTDGTNTVHHAGNNLEAIQAGEGNDTFLVTTNQSLTLLGGGGSDQFVLSNGVTLTGVVDGQAGYDTLDLSAYATIRNVVLTGTGSVDGFSGTENAISGSFTNIDQILGSSSAGGSLTGRNSDATFELDGTNRYISGNTLDFSDFGILHGGSASDTFETTGNQIFELFGGSGNDIFSFADEATLTGNIDGQTGMNSLDFSDYLTSRFIFLTGYGSQTGFTGNEFCINGVFTNISHIAGGFEVDELSGTNDTGVWTITPTGGSYIANNRTLTFTSIETLAGSAGDDRFVFQDGATLGGSIDGRAGNDTIDFSAYTSGVTADLRNGEISPLVGGVTSVENVIGGSGNDVLNGNDEDNLLNGGGGDDIIHGWGGNDTLYTGNGHDIVYGDDGDDVLYVQPGDHILYGGDGYDTAYIWSGAIYVVPLNDIESLQNYRQPQPDNTGGQGYIPVTGGYYLVIPVESEQQEQLFCVNCPGVIGIILQLPNFDQVYFGLEASSFASLTVLPELELPAPLPVGKRLVSSIRIDYWLNGIEVKKTRIIERISFVIPEGINPDSLSIWHWDEEQMTWVEVPSFQLTELETGDYNRLDAFIQMAGVYILVVEE